jgi:cytochrome P450
MTDAVLDYDPFDPQIRANPYPAYRMLREAAPVYWAERTGAFCISRYADVSAVLRRPQDFSSEAMRTMLAGGTAGADPLTDPRFLEQMIALSAKLPFPIQELAAARNLIAEDPPIHDRLRRIVNRGFTPRRIAAWEGRARELAEQCVAELRRAERFDLVSQLAIPLPVILISEILGVEPERREDFKRWSDGIVASTTGSGHESGVLANGFADVFSEFSSYFLEIIERRRREARDDLISILVGAETGEEGLQPVEVVMFALLLLVAGNETTTNLIGNTVSALLAHPEQLALVRGEPALVPALVEEGLRYDSPVQLLFRRVRREVEIAGVRIPAGAVVAPMVGSANRDPEQFERPDAFDVRRDTQGHLAFGFGVHFCLGASLARLEARAALEALIPELPGRAGAGSEPEWIDSFLLRGPKRLELLRAA